ncbi:MAG: DNA recombination/repair protein RecA, partial [Patescibacteria group bacterium]
EIVGNRVTVKVVKNKVAAPFRIAEFDIMYNEGISREGDIINCGLKYGLLSKSGTWIDYNDQKLGQGFGAARQYLKENQDLVKKLTQEIKKSTPA